MGSVNALAGSSVYLDANIIIYAIEDLSAVGAKLRSLFERFDRGELRAITSQLTPAEVLVKPLRDGKTTICDSYMRMLQTSPALQVVAITRDILIDAARLRAGAAIKLPDAIHAATALRAACTTFLTNDGGFQTVVGLPVLLLSKLT